jgi:hypothetical protein
MSNIQYTRTDVLLPYIYDILVRTFIAHSDVVLRFPWMTWGGMKASLQPGNCVRSDGLFNNQTIGQATWVITCYHVTGHCRWTVRGMSRQNVGNMFMTHVSTDFRRFCKPQDTGASCRVEYVVNPCLLDVGNGVGLDKLSEIQRERRIERNGVIIRKYNTTSTSNTVPPY